MESTRELAGSPLFVPQSAIRANDLLPALNYYADKINVLSLDCFDTLLWRWAASPIDVFHDLQHKPTFQSHKISAVLRGQIETLARGLRFIQDQTTEVTLHDIYRAGFPDLPIKELDKLVEEEIQAEMEACYAFPPMVKLIEQAHARGIKIIIVSNTYFNEPQLRRLLRHCLPKNVLECISHVFCSADYNVSKNNGLFRHVQARLNESPEKFFHLGDNPDADLNAARQAGMHAAHFIQYDGIIHEQLRMYATSASVFVEGIRSKKSLATPYRGILSSAHIDQPEKIVGYASMGSIMYAFAEFICDEINRLTTAGKSLKVMFIMRDAHLPQLACETLLGQRIGHRIYLSRFAVYASSFCNREAINTYLLRMSYTGRFHALSRQLLLPEEIIEPLVSVVRQSPNPSAEFVSQLQRPEFQEIIIKKSALYRQRLFAYLKKETGLQPGDTLMFVDLGYSGSAQRMVGPLLEKEYNVEVIGRYLIQLDVPQWEKTRRGLMDPSWCDIRSMKSIVEYVALLEQVCTSHERSVVDYTEDGTPIFSEAVLNDHQYQKLLRVQNECLRFVKDAKNFFNETGKIPLEVLREVTLGELGRMIFLPTKAEIDYLESFQFDINLGTNDVVQVFDSKKGLDSLCKRGLFFQYMERNSKSMRTNSPSEMRAAGLELGMMLMTQARFAIELNYSDMSFRRETVNVSVMENHIPILTPVEAMLTYDGFYSITLPTSRSFYNLKVLFGEKYQWVEIHSVEQFDRGSYLYLTESLQAHDCYSQLNFNQMVNRGGKLYECQSDEGSMSIASFASDNEMMRIVFRPIVKRD